MEITKESWNTRLGVILAVSGSAVGLGNFLRFPGQVAEYGGGAFMVAYFIAFLAIGLPICWVEWTLGRMGGRYGFNSSPSIFAAISGHPRFKYVGIVAIVIPLSIYMYYVVIEAWCLAYSTNYLLGNLDFTEPEDASAFFAGMIGLHEHGSALKFDLQHVGVYVLLVFVLNFYLIYRGISRGIELFCIYAMPTLVVIAIIILIRVLTLGTPDPDHPDRNISNGLGFMWNPSKLIIQERLPEGDGWVDVTEVFAGDDYAALQTRLAADPGLRLQERTMMHQLRRPELWLAAASQIFFSLSVGFGVIITYASYLKRKDDIVLSGLAAASANEFCEVSLGGLISIPAAVAFFGVSGLAAIGLGTFDIGFNVLPLVFSQMPFGMFFGFLFFFLLFLAAVTSSLSMLQPGIAYLEESMRLSRKQSVTFLGLITAMGAGFILYFSEGLKALATIDYWVTNCLMVLLALFQVIVYGWVIGLNKSMENTHQGSIIRIPRIYWFVIRYVSPLALIIIFLTWFYTNVLGLPFGAEEGGVNSYVRDLFIQPDTVAWMSIGVLAILAAFLYLSMPDSNRFRDLEPDS